MIKNKNLNDCIIQLGLLEESLELVKIDIEETEEPVSEDSTEGVSNDPLTC